MRLDAQAPPLIAAAPHRCRLALVLLAGMALAGCSSLQPPTLLSLSIGVDADQGIDSDQRRDFQDRLAGLLEDFRQLHPGTHIQMGLYPEERLAPAMRRRSRAGLEPDLLFLNGDTALQLLNAGLVDPFPASAGLLHSFAPAALSRVRNARGQLAGLPVLLQTQFSCYDRRRVPKPPRTLDALLALSASGQPVGLSVDPANLLWTSGSLGAIPALQRLVEGQPLLPADRSALLRWLRWLEQANTQQRITFFASQPAVDGEFSAGRLAWIPCRSGNIPLLRRRLGANLMVASLPDGADGQSAAPVNRLRVLAIGRQSSASGRQRALDFARFVTNPLTQRTLTMGTLTVLPANRFVTVPVQSSTMLKAMVMAARQGRQADGLAALLHGHDHRIAPLQTLLTRLVFGETQPEAALDALVRLLEPQR